MVSVAWLQHLSLGLLKEMLLALDLAQALGTPADRKAADRLQRRLACWWFSSLEACMPCWLSSQPLRDSRLSTASQDTALCWFKTNCLPLNSQSQALWGLPLLRRRHLHSSAS